MNIGIIKDTICVNTAVFNDFETAQEFLINGAFPDNPDTVVELPDGYGIDDTYIDGEWVKKLAPEPIIDRAAKYTELDTACSEAIVNGVDVATSHGLRHFDFTIAGQNNINDAMNTIRDAKADESLFPLIADGIPFKAADGECLYYTVEDIQKIDLIKKAHILYNRTYLSVLLAWCETVTDAELSEITYGAELPYEYKRHVDEIMKPLNDLLEQLNENAV